MIVVCSTETNATIRWSLNAVPLPCFAECVWGGCNGHANRVWGLWRQFKFSNLFACPFNLLTPHSATQWEEECSGVNAVLLVSLLQTRSSWMFVFKKLHSYSLKNLMVNSCLQQHQCMTQCDSIGQFKQKHRYMKACQKWRTCINNCNTLT